MRVRCLNTQLGLSVNIEYDAEDLGGGDLLIYGKTYRKLRFKITNESVIGSENTSSKEKYTTNIGDNNEKKESNFNSTWLNKIEYFYHITSKENIKSIVQYGLCSWKYLENKGIKIPVQGGNQESKERDERQLTENYVKLCFNKKHPMFYTPENKEKIKKQWLIFIDKKCINLIGTKFSNTNSASPYAKIFEDKDIVDKLIDIDLAISGLRNRDEEKKKKVQAEVLIYEKIPIQYLIKAVDIENENNVYYFNKK